MANPRQRRKLRSGAHKPVQHSRRAKKLLKKQPPIRGPKVLQEAWDPRKTVRQNYEALGLAASLNPIASGGTERAARAHAVPGDEDEDGSGKEATGPSSESGKEGREGGSSGLRKGFGKIIRDAEGNIVDVQMGDEGGDEGVGMTEGGLEEVLDPSGDSRLAGWVGLGSDPREGSSREERVDTRVVQALEQLSSAGTDARAPRFTSHGERGLLQRLVERHGEDVEAMARDRRLNAEQRTAGELRRAIRKAGGIGAVRVGRAGG
ncbi:ribosome biogenesis protein Nop16 [Earliella scabrosa]|nr:ribosome biogenesis protein Nop16 [Earliella scabrosa]